jgi:hypothetical protein
MTDLERELAHAQAMATATHRPDCPVKRRARFSDRGHVCTGCVTDADRALWSQLADEYAAQLDRHREDTLL